MAGRFAYSSQFQPSHTKGPDRLELIIFDITGKKINNHRSCLIIEFFSAKSIMFLSGRVRLIAKR